MKETKINNDFTAYDWGTEPITLYGNVAQMLPTEIHHKADGSKNGEPSFAFVFTHPHMPARVRLIGQLSIKMLNEGLEAFGYQIIKKEETGQP